MHLGALTPPEQRVLGSLIEKRWTTPDQYPLSLNSLRLACNQLTNRDPVTHYDEATVRDAAQRLSRYGLTRLASGHGSRSVKYRHLAEETLSLGREELAVLAVLLLRGPQTPGEIKARTERMATLGSLADVERILETLSERGYARRMPRRPGQKEDRFEQLLGEEGESEMAGEDARGGAVVGGAGGGTAVGSADGGGVTAVGSAYDGGVTAVGSADDGGDGPPISASTEPVDGSLDARIATLETEVADLRRLVTELLERP